MKILFAAAEVAPFSKVGGLADVAGALPQELVKNTVRVTVISPLYRSVNREDYGIKSTNISGSIYMDEKDYPYRIFSVTVDRSLPLEHLFVENDYCFNRDGIYTLSDGRGYPDNNKRFFFFQKVIADLLVKGLLKPELLHLNDHHTALVALMLKAQKIMFPVLLTVHNFQYQGGFGSNDLKLLSELEIKEIKTLLPHSSHRYSALEIGLLTADRVNTVSRGYAEELLRRRTLAFGLTDTLKSIGNKFTGILNGVDYEVWNPESDKFLEFHFSADSMDGKSANKKLLQQCCNLPLNPGIPLIGSVSRLVTSKGFGLFLAEIDALMWQDIQMVFLGSGSVKIESSLKRAVDKYPGRMFFSNNFDEKLAHLIEAGCDMFLMPSRFEPCGLNQMYSLKYGTIPIVHKTGGLADTVQNWDGQSGNGFVFKQYRKIELLNVVKRACNTYAQPKQWKSIIRQAMLADFSWFQSAHKYKEVYQDVLKEESRSEC